MAAVHARRHQHFIQQPFEADRQPQIAVMKKRIRLEDQFVSPERPARETDQAHLHDAKSDRHRYLAKVKPKPSGNIKIGIDVMNVVKSPEEWDSMICDVPIVKAEVHEQKAECERKQRRQRQEKNQTKNISIRQVQ